MEIDWAAWCMAPIAPGANAGNELPRHERRRAVTIGSKSRPAFLKGKKMKLRTLTNIPIRFVKAVGIILLCAVLGVIDWIMSCFDEDEPCRY